MYYHRTLEDPLLGASQQFPVILVTGPRQVGKTTLLRHLCSEDRNYVSLDDLTHRALANRDPELFLQHFPPPVLIDEIQYAPDLLPFIKLHVDETRRPGFFWLTGSQHFHMMKGITESLAGRVAVINLLGFSRPESLKRPAEGEAFLPSRASGFVSSSGPRPASLKPLFKKIWAGSFPGLIAGPIRDRDLFYSSYIQTYLQRDVRDLAQVGKQETFLRFLKACAARTGQLLNLSNLARDTGVNVNTAKSWLSILETSCQIALLQPYYSNITKRLIKTPKLYFLDTGLCSYLTDWSSPETLASGAMRGAIFETHVFAEVLKSWWHRLLSPRLYYYRDKDGKEIDLLFEKDGTLYPAEVKLGVTPQRDWTRSFTSLERLNLPVGDRAIICLCKDVMPLTPQISLLPAGFIGF